MLYIAGLQDTTSEYVMIGVLYKKGFLQGALFAFILNIIKIKKRDIFSKRRGGGL